MTQNREVKKGLCWVFAVVFALTVIGVAGLNHEAQAKEYSKVLRFASPLPAQSFAGKMHQWWAKELEKRTNGRVKTQFFWMESLVKWKDGLQGVASGIADVTLVASTYHPSDLPLYMLVDMPYNAVDYYAGARAVTDTATQDPGLVAELRRNNVVHVAPWISGKFNFCTKKPWDKLADLKGKTFRTYGGAFVEYMEQLGINPIFMPYSEIYEALTRGTIDGNGTCVLQLSDALKHYEATVQCTDMNAGFVLGGSGLLMNLKVYDGMPKDIQKILLQLNYDMGVYWAKSLYEVEGQIAKKWQTKYGIKFNKLSPSDEALSEAAGKKAQDDFLKNLESKGLHPRETWDFFRARVVKYQKEVKEKGYPWEH